MKILSHIMIARNDNYLGNFKQRLEMAVNYTCAKVAAIKRLEDYELLICDWNSETPLRQALNLNEFARQCVSFLEVPPEMVARHGWPHIPLARTPAVNVAGRRAEGIFLLVTPSDVFFPQASLRNLFALLEGENPFLADPANCYLGVERFMIPWQAAERLTLDQLDRYLLLHTSSCSLFPRPYGWAGGEGGTLVARDLIHRLNGMNEDYVLASYTETELARHISQFSSQWKATVAGVFCYDLDQRPQVRRTIQRNAEVVRLNPVYPNKKWGLADEDIPRRPALFCPEADNQPLASRPYDEALFLGNSPELSTYGAYRMPHVPGFFRRAWRTALKADFLTRRAEKVAEPVLSLTNKGREISWMRTHTPGLIRSSYFLIFDAILRQWLNSGGQEKERGLYYLDDWYGPREKLASFLEQAVSEAAEKLGPYGLTRWNLGKVYVTLALMATVARLRPRRFFYAEGRNFYVLQAAALVEPALEIVAYDHWQGEARSTTSIDHGARAVQFKGRLDLLTGPMETAFERLRSIPLIGEPFDCVCLNLNYFKLMVNNPTEHLAGLLAPECALVAYGTAVQVEPFTATLTAKGFKLAARLSNIVVLVRQPH